MIPTRHPPVSTDALASVDFFLSHSALKSCRESWEHMVQAPGLDGITLGGTLRDVKSVDQSTNKRTIPSLFSYISPFVCSYNPNYTGGPLGGPGIIGIF